MAWLQCTALSSVYLSTQWAFGHAKSLTFWPQNLISSSLSQDALVTSLEKIHQCIPRDIVETNPQNAIFNIFGCTVTPTFDLLTQNLTSSSLSQDVLATKVQWKSNKAYHRKQHPRWIHGWTTCKRTTNASSTRSSLDVNFSQLLSQQFLQVGCPSSCPTNSVKTLKDN